MINLQPPTTTNYVHRRVGVDRRNIGSQEASLLEHPSARYTGSRIIDSVSGTVEVVFPSSKRRMRRRGSAAGVATLVGLVAAAYFGMFILERRTVAKLHTTERGDPTRWLLQLEQQGIYLSAGVLVSVINIGFKRYALAVTKYENYRTKTEHNTVLQVRSFTFQFFNSFSGLTSSGGERVAPCVCPEPSVCRNRYMHVIRGFVETDTCMRSGRGFPGAAFLSRAPFNPWT